MGEKNTLSHVTGENGKLRDLNKRLIAELRTARLDTKVGDGRCS